MKILDIVNKIEETKQIIKHAPDIIGQEAVEFYEQSFHDEGFTDKALEKWDDVKRRREPRKGREGRAGTTRKILTGETGVLGDSLEYKVIGDEVTVESHVPYAEAHNKGTENAGRNRNVVIPKRQFIGESQKLNTTLKFTIEEQIKSKFK